MKKIILLSLLCGLSQAHAEILEKAVHCDQTYEGKPFVQATIWSNTSGFGRAECDYKDAKDKNVISYKFPEQDQYYVVSGNWQSTMPGIQWCSIDNGNTFNSCLFAKKITTT